MTERPTNDAMKEVLHGEFAVAALKPRGPAPRGVRGVASPRRIRRGRIEAPAPGKPVDFGRISPRRIRRGRIEATIRSSGLGLVAIFPRRIRRGRIEAVIESLGEVRSVDFSTANSPWPH